MADDVVDLDSLEGEGRGGRLEFLVVRAPLAGNPYRPSDWG